MVRAPRTRLLLTCEHGGNRVPVAWASCFRGARRALDSHRGFDAGALATARHLGRALGAPLLYATVTRLLVDLNRSRRHPGLFSPWSAQLGPAERERVVARHWSPYRDRVAHWIAAALDAGDRVLHVSVHSFTPVLDGVRRRADIGLLYDPASAAEARLCRTWQRALVEAGWNARRNYPYRGTSDGQVVALRRRFGTARYAGIELELNQAVLAGRGRSRLLADLAKTFPAP